ncbi:MAG: DUF3601 domain-containing protein [Cyclobacteriaceae bacterium]|nr:DUF3601 domain-containing protein [Cyclobacteriaceae bacterium]
MYVYLNDLKPGDKIKVIKEFNDFDNQLIPVGSEWTFEKYTYFPYDGGYTFYFKEGIMRMAEISECDYYVATHAKEYFILLVEPTDTWS